MLFFMENDRLKVVYVFHLETTLQLVIINVTQIIIVVNWENAIEFLSHLSYKMWRDLLLPWIHALNPSYFASSKPWSAEFHWVYSYNSISSWPLLQYTGLDGTASGKHAAGDFLHPEH